jgi:hypothetical protein
MLCLLSDIPNLFMIETIDSIRLATTVDAAWQRLETTKKLNVMIQVNTSSEDSKTASCDISSKNLCYFFTMSIMHSCAFPCDNFLNTCCMINFSLKYTWMYIYVHIDIHRG